MKPETESWLKQAEEDLKYADAATTDAFYAWACFACQQAAEKALKALLIEHDVEFPRTHQLITLAQHAERTAPSVKDLRAQLDVLNQYYAPTRYADLHGGTAPFEHYTEAMAREAITFARTVVTTIREAFGA